MFNVTNNLIDFLDMKPLGFDNKSRIHIDFKQETLNWKSSHMILSYIIATLNGILIGTFLFISLKSGGKVFVSFVSTVMIVVLQIVVCGWYLGRKDKRGRRLN